jgi:hypothetical protein
LTEAEPIRRVPLRTLWIKGIRTIWQLRMRLGIVWLACVAIPALYLNLNQNLRALEITNQLGAQTQAQKVPDIVEIITEISVFIAQSFSQYCLVLLVFAFGWMMSLVIANRYFQGFPQAGWSIVLSQSISRLAWGGFVAVAVGLTFGAAGIAGFPILDLLAVVLLMVPAYQVGASTRFFRGVADCVSLKYGAHFKGGRFLAIVQLAILSLFVSSLIVLLNQCFHWSIDFVASNSISGQTISNPADFPLANVALVIMRDIAVATIIFLIPTYQMTLYYWLYSIPRSMPASGIMA